MTIDPQTLTRTLLIIIAACWLSGLTAVTVMRLLEAEKGR